jgi:hypothetical protein
MKHSPHPKTVLHGQGAGEITRGDIEQRAREIAVIQGRSEDDVTAADRAQAQAEMSGELLPATTVDDAQGLGAISRDPSEPPSIDGKEAPMAAEPNEQGDLESMVLEGVEEAQHDQMIAARRRREP